MTLEYQKLRGGGGDAIALKPPKADVPSGGQLKQLPKGPFTLGTLWAIIGPSDNHSWP